VKQTDTPSTHTIRYDAIEEFNVDSKAESGELNLAHVTRNEKNIKKKKVMSGKLNFQKLLYENDRKQANNLGRALPYINVKIPH